MARKRTLLIALAALVAVLAVHNVPAAPSAEDIAFGDRILAAAGYEGPKRGFGDLRTFESQLAAIRATQDAVIRMAALDEEIPFDRAREPRDVFEEQKGLCYDRSRAIEKILAMLGFEVRHVAVYATTERGSLAAILTPGNGSHALSEVKTAKGWMLVDPNVRWIGLTADGTLIDAAAMRSAPPGSRVWVSQAAAKPHAIFEAPYVFVRGLYSRHGRFYPPYTPVPDVNWRQLLDNFAS